MNILRTDRDTASGDAAGDAVGGYEEIDLSPGRTLAQAAQIVEEGVQSLGLRVAQRGTLAEYPGCIHWHFKRGRETGTLEATLLNRERRLQISVRANRQGAWTSTTLDALTMFCAERLSP